MAFDIEAIKAKIQGMRPQSFDASRMQSMMGALQNPNFSRVPLQTPEQMPVSNIQSLLAQNRSIPRETFNPNPGMINRGAMAPVGLDQAQDVSRNSILAGGGIVADRGTSMRGMAQGMPSGLGQGMPRASLAMPRPSYQRPQPVNFSSRNSALRARTR